MNSFYDEVSSLTRHIPKHNVLIIGSDMIAHIGKYEYNKSRLYNSPKRNGEHFAEFSLPKHKIPKEEGKTIDLHRPK